MTQATNTNTMDRLPLRVSPRDLVQLTKPRIAVMVLITAWIGFHLAPAADGGAGHGVAHAVAFIGMLLGTLGACLGAAALNQYLERDVDALMRRTKGRPLPAARLEPTVALLTGVMLSVVGVTTLRVMATPLAALLAAVTVLLYVLVYTPAKRVTVWNTWIGAVPGAMPPLIGYAASAGRLGTSAWLIFALMVLWQIPHFYAIAWVYREQYAGAGFRMRPIVDPTGRWTFIEATLAAVGLFGVLWLAQPVTQPRFTLIAGLLTGLFVLLSLRAMVRPTVKFARRLFFYSLIYLPVVLTLWVVYAR